MSPTSRSPSNTRICPVPVTSPMAVPWTSHVAQTASTSSRRAGSQTHSIRSCDSDTMISNGSMPASRSGTRAMSRSMPISPFEAISDALEVRPAAPRSCSETSRPRSSSSSEHSSSFFSANGSPTWTVGRLSSSASPSSAEASTDAPPMPSRPADPPAEAVAPGRRAEQHDDVTDAGRRARHQAVRRAEPERQRVHEAVVLVARLEVDLAADCRHADRVAVVADPRDRAVEQVARALRRLRVAEAQRVEHRDRARADREDVAQDPADAGRCALERLDGARVVVRLDLERAREPTADVDGARVLAGPHQYEA